MERQGKDGKDRETVSRAGRPDQWSHKLGVTRRQACKSAAALLAFLGATPFFGLKRLAWSKPHASRRKEDAMDLTKPRYDGPMSVEQAIKKRRTVRTFKDKPLSADQFLQILWAAQGITEENGFKRAAPSGGALYPADVYAVAGKDSVDGMSQGVYHFRPGEYAVDRIAEGDRRTKVATASLGQMWMAAAPVQIVLTAQYNRITRKYGDRGERYALIEIGHIGQNVFLQCQALGLAAGIVGAFNDRELAGAIGLPEEHEPLIVMPVGRPR